MRGRSAIVAFALVTGAFWAASATGARPDRESIRLCDGEPPELINRDARAHVYELRCGDDTERATIAAGATQVLKGKSGCRLVLPDNPPVRLSTEMVCTIESSELSCDLL